ncbi:MAG: ABC transporter permease [Chloroflexi bacterium]|nr:ABC transporter permease [Chloroflexota bacterium]
MSAAALTLTAWSALLTRDLRAFIRSRSQLGSSLIFPLMLLAGVGVGVSEGLEPTKVRDGDYVTFLVPGIIVMTALFSSTFSSASFYQDRDSGMLKIFLVSPHSPATIMLGKSLGAITIGTVQALVVLAVASAVPAIDLVWQYGVPTSLLLAVGTIVVLNVLLSGLAQVLASRIRTMQGFHLVMNLVLFPLLFFSGAFFPLADLPAWLRGLALANPLTYAVDLLQLALYADGGAGYIGVGIDIAVLIALAVALFGWSMRHHPVME